MNERRARWSPDRPDRGSYRREAYCSLCAAGLAEAWHNYRDGEGWYLDAFALAPELTERGFAKDGLAVYGRTRRERRGKDGRGLRGAHPSAQPPKLLYAYEAPVTAQPPYWVYCPRRGCEALQLLEPAPLPSGEP